MRVDLAEGATTAAPVERRQDVRFIGNIAGRYTLSNAQGVIRGSDAQVFACRINSISPAMAVVSAPVSGHVGELVAANFDHFGIIHGHVTRVLPGGFAFDIDTTEEGRENLALKIEWMKKKVFRAVQDKRAHKRVRPRTPQAVLKLVDNTSVPAFIIDVSCSGVAVSADLAPAVGSVMAVGKVLGRVVRKLDVGFAVQFVEVQSMTFVEQLLTTAHEGPIAELIPKMTAANSSSE